MPALSESPPHNLPAQLTTLIGRKRETEALTRLLIEDGARLLTLTGPGGSGKTRLAIEVASTVAGTYADGVFWVNLAPLTEPHLVPSAIAQALSVRQSGWASVSDALKDFLANRRLLLLLDNFEQVIDGASLVADLLLACPGLQIVATSRAALRLRGEREFSVPPLALPDRSQPLGLPELRRYAAVSLFLERAQAVSPDLVLTEDVGHEIAAICARLDGLPLAIELAAARTKLLTPAAILARLDRRLSLLTDGARDLPERQRTLRGAIAWSYDLLDDAERAFFRWLSVFSGGFTLEAAEVMRSNPPEAGTLRQRATGILRQAQDERGQQAAGNSAGSVVSPGLPLPLGPKGSPQGEGPPGWTTEGRGEGTNALDLIASLVDKNLLRRAEVSGTEARFELLETIREFGLEALAAAGDLEEAHRQHTQVFLTLAEEAEPHLTEQGNQVLLQRLEREHDNLRAALRWNIDHGYEAEGLRLAGALWQFWQLWGYASEGRQWLEAVLGMGAAAPTPERARALTGAGMLALFQGDFGVARAYHEQSLAIRRALDDQWNAAVSVNDLGTVALYQGDYPTALGLYEDSLRLRQGLDDRHGSAVSLTNLGLVAAAQGELERAREYHEQSLALRRDLGDRAGITRSLNRLGAVAAEQRDYAAARRYLSEAITLSQEDGDRQALASSLSYLGIAALNAGDLEEAETQMEESVSIRREIGDVVPIAWTLWHLAHLVEARGDWSLALTYCDEALPTARKTGDKHGQALWLYELGDVALQLEDYARARAAYEESLGLRRQLGDEGGAAVTMAKLAQLCHHDGEVARARALLEESVQILRHHGERPALAASLTNLAQLLLAQGELAAAEAHYREALQLQRELGNEEMVALCLRGLAALAEAHPDDRPAAPHPDGLSEREVDVLRLIAAGRSNQAIAAELVISVNTVFRHVSNIFAKTGANNRVEAAAYAQRHRLV